MERVACLSYYLTHLRNMPHFKTADISALNIEAAQPKFSNAANAMENATKCGYLVPAIRGTKQLGAMGEQFVRALPDREVAEEVASRLRPRRYKKRASSSPEQPGVPPPSNDDLTEDDAGEIPQPRE